MSVLMVTRESAADRRYGLGKSLWPIVDELASRGVRIRYLSQEDVEPRKRLRRMSWLSELARWPGIKDHPHRLALLGAWLERMDMGFIAAQVARSGEFGHVHLHDPWIAACFCLARLYYPGHKVRWGLTEHGFGSYSRATQEDGLIQGQITQWILRRIEAAVLRQANWVMVPTRLSLKQLRRDLGFQDSPRHWKIVPHARPNMKHWSRRESRHALGWAEESLVILAIGRLVPLKRFELLVKSFITLAATHDVLHLCILGEGDRDKLWMPVLAAGLSHRVQIQAVDDISPYLSGADVYVSTSTTESFGLANLEALAAGLPVICTEVGGVPEVIGTGGYLVDVECDQLEKVLKEFIDSPETRRHWGKKGRRRADKWPDVTQVTDAYVAIYQQ